MTEPLLDSPTRPSLLLWREMLPTIAYLSYIGKAPQYNHNYFPFVKSPFNILAVKPKDTHEHLQYLAKKQLSYPEVACPYAPGCDPIDSPAPQTHPVRFSPASIKSNTA
jgi:hypothetical protein